MAGLGRLSAPGGVSPLSLPYINVRNYPYNAVGDGVADDKAAVDAAIAAAIAAKIDTVWFPRTAGGYRLTSTVTIANDSVKLKGDHSIIYRDFGTGPTIKFAKAANAGILDVAVDGFEFTRNTATAQGTSDVAHIRFVNAVRARVQDVRSNNCVEGIELNGGAYYDIANCQLVGQYSATAAKARFGIKGSKTTATVQGADLPSYVRISNVDMYGPGLDGFAYPLWITAGEFWDIMDSYFGQSKFFNVLIEQGSDNASILDVMLKGCYIDGAVRDGFFITGSGIASGDTFDAAARTGGNGTAGIANISIVENVIKGNITGRDGIRVDGSSRGGTIPQASIGLTINDNTITSWLGNGINLLGGVDTVVVGNRINGNNFSNTLAGSGIVVGAASVRPVIAGNRIGGDANGNVPGNQVYGIDIISGVTRYVISGNQIEGNATAGLRSASDNGVLCNNPGGDLFATITELSATVVDIGVKSSGGAPVIRARWGSSPFNWLEVIGANTGQSVRLAATGSDTNINFSIEPKGAGLISCTKSLRTFAGTATAAPFVIQAGTNLTTPAVGCVEYDGKAYYATAVANARQVVAAEQVTTLTADSARADVATVQQVFDSTEDSITLAASTTYEFEALYYLTRAAGTTSHTFAVLFGGTATLTSIDYLAEVTNPTGNVLAAASQIMGVAATALTLTAANTSATENIIVKLRGTIRTNAAGTLIPQFQYSAAPGGAPTVKRNSFFRLWAIGVDTVKAVGNWA